MDNRWKKTVIRSTRFSPVLMDMIKTECKCRRIDFSNYIRLAATAAMKHNKKSGSAEASKGERRKLNKGNENDKPHRTKATFEAFQAVFAGMLSRHTTKGSFGRKN